MLQAQLKKSYKEMPINKAAVDGREIAKQRHQRKEANRLGPFARQDLKASYLKAAENILAMCRVFVTLHLKLGKLVRGLTKQYDQNQLCVCAFRLYSVKGFQRLVTGNIVGCFTSVSLHKI